MKNNKTETPIEWFYDKIKSHFEHDGDLVFHLVCLRFQKIAKLQHGSFLEKIINN